MRRTATTPTGAHWDSSSGVRERLYLLSRLGPTMTPNDWGYHASRDFWYGCGPTATPRRVLEVRTEGSQSLAQIESDFQMSRAQALEFIGYPESA